MSTVVIPNIPQIKKYRMTTNATCNPIRHSFRNWNKEVWLKQFGFYKRKNKIPIKLWIKLGWNLKDWI